MKTINVTVKGTAEELQSAHIRAKGQCRSLSGQFAWRIIREAVNRERREGRKHTTPTEQP